MLAVVVLGVLVMSRANLWFQGSDSVVVFVRAPELVIDPSTAPAGVLEALPSLGPGLVSRMVAAREAGPFASTEDLRRRVRGLGPITLAKLRPFLRIKAADEIPGPNEELAGKTAMDSTRTQPSLAQISKRPELLTPTR